MADVTAKTFDELDSYQDRFLYAGKSVGVSAWGMNIVRMPPSWDGYPEHDHGKDGQEEVYLPLAGSARLEAGGESWDLAPGMLVRVGPNQKRKIIPGADGATILVIGGTPGKAYQAPS
jgi:uncharacterized cupin superfamily protein